MLSCYSYIVTKTSTITSLKGFKRCLYEEQPFHVTSMVHAGPPTSVIVASQGGEAYWITVPTGQASVHVFHHSVRSTFCNSHRTNRGGTIKAFIFFLSSSYCYILMMFPYSKPSNLAMYWTGACISRLQYESFIHFPSYNFIFLNRIKLPQVEGHYQTSWCSAYHSWFLTRRMQFWSHLNSLTLLLWRRRQQVPPKHR
jgi:hypothetical protein